jgi:hypothetical protein
MRRKRAVKVDASLLPKQRKPIRMFGNSRLKLWWCSWVVASHTPLSAVLLGLSRRINTNATETLATQMVATNDAALMFLHRATIAIAHRSGAIHQTDSDHPNDQTHCSKRWKDLDSDWLLRLQHSGCRADSLRTVLAVRNVTVERDVGFPKISARHNFSGQFVQSTISARRVLGSRCCTITMPARRDGR